MADQPAPTAPQGAEVLTEIPEPGPRLKPEQVYARYIGAPNYLAGLGACDLTREELAAADPSTTARALDLKLYTLVDAPAVPPAESAA